jgi:tellurite resistance protein TehA-like permease
MRSQTDRGWPTAGAASLLPLAAAPTFAIMALLAGIQGAGMPDMLCAAAHDSSWLTGMVPMYLLMGTFHLAPWLRLVANRRQTA